MSIPCAALTHDAPDDDPEVLPATVQHFTELEKIREARAEGSDVIGTFLVWLQDQVIHLMYFVEQIPNGRSHDDYVARYGEEPPVTAEYWPESVNRLLARYYDIDADKAEQERDEILAQLRAMNSGADQPPVKGDALSAPQT